MLFCWACPCANFHCVLLQVLDKDECGQNVIASTSRIMWGFRPHILHALVHKIT